MEQLSAAIDRFAAAADRLEHAATRAARRAEALKDGASAQGAVIERLRRERAALLDQRVAPPPPAEPRAEALREAAR